jgi:hypothetical protein
MSKHQMGLRVDRVLYRQFQQLCIMENLRPGEAVETLIRVALEAKTITGVRIDQAKQESTIHLFDDALFRSRLDRFKKSLELEEQYLKENGELEDNPESGYWIKELTELGRRSVSKELVQEFETCLAKADKLYEDAETKRLGLQIGQH